MENMENLILSCHERVIVAFVVTSAASFPPLIGNSTSVFFEDPSPPHSLSVGFRWESFKFDNPFQCWAINQDQVKMINSEIGT